MIKEIVMAPDGFGQGAVELNVTRGAIEVVIGDANTPPSVEITLSGPRESELAKRIVVETSGNRFVVELIEQAPTAILTGRAGTMVINGDYHVGTMVINGDYHVGGTHPDLMTQGVRVHVRATVPPLTALTVSTATGQVSTDRRGLPSVVVRTGSGDVVTTGRNVNVKTGSGRIDATGWSLDVKSGSGSIDVDGEEVRARSGSGSITVRGGAVQAQSGSGPILVRGNGVQPSGKIVARSGSGSIRVEHTAARVVDVSTGSGPIDVTCASGDTRVHARSGSGAVRVTGGVRV